jgi:glutamate synthase domain-containing protein 2
MSDGYGKPQQVARYIAEMCTELREIAHRAGLSFLAHLLSMVILQAGKHHHADGQALGRTSEAQSND